MLSHMLLNTKDQTINTIDDKHGPAELMREINSTKYYTRKHKSIVKYFIAIAVKVNSMNHYSLVVGNLLVDLQQNDDISGMVMTTKTLDPSADIIIKSLSFKVFPSRVDPVSYLLKAKQEHTDEDYRSLNESCQSFVREIVEGLTEGHATVDIRVHPFRKWGTIRRTSHGKTNLVKVAKPLCV